MKPPRSCTNCRLRKKKCDRAYPVCSICLRNKDNCSYPGGTRLSRPLSRLRIAASSSAQHSEPSEIPYSAAFLDYSLWRGISAREAFTTHVTIDQGLRDAVVGDSNVQHYLSSYTANFGSWMPFIPEADLQKVRSRAPSQWDNGDVLLAACIKNLEQCSGDEDARQRFYLAIKSAIIGAEVSEPISVQQLQWLLLVLLYEFGHGIYPAAYTTLGTCLRYLSAMGLDHVDSIHPLPGKAWVDGEAKRRLWWAVYVLERCMSLGNPQRSLYLKQPSDDSIIPSDDASWAEGAFAAQADITITSPAAKDMGSFRLLVHAAFLLGRILGFIADQNPLQPEEAQQVQRTVSALLKVLEVEDQLGIIAISVPRAILSSASFFIDNLSTGNTPSTTDLSPLTASPASLSLPSSYCQRSAELFLNRVRYYLQGDLGDVSGASPFVLNWGYETFKYYFRKMRREGMYDNFEALRDIQIGFQALSKRWRLASVYCSILHFAMNQNRPLGSDSDQEWQEMDANMMNTE